MLPQIAACDLQRYKFLKTHLIDEYVESRKNDIFVNLQASYSCMGISCDNVGYLNSNCVDLVGNVAMAGYLSSVDIHEVSNVDYFSEWMGVSFDLVFLLYETYN